MQAHPRYRELVEQGFAAASFVGDLGIRPLDCGPVSYTHLLPQAGAIAFLADPQRRYEGVPLADQYQALSRDVLLEDYLGLRRQLARAGLDDEARERLAGMAARLESWLALGGRGDQACPCGLSLIHISLLHDWLLCQPIVTKSA